MAARRLSESERAALQARCEQLQLELRMLTAELRSDEALRVQAATAAAGSVRGRPVSALAKRSEYLRRLYGGR